MGVVNLYFCSMRNNFSEESLEFESSDKSDKLQKLAQNAA